MPDAALPRVDEHSTSISAGGDVVWSALLDTVDVAFSRPGATLYARAVGCAATSASGPRPLAEGATIPGFRVTAAAAGHDLVLEGHHRFSSYALRFRLDQLSPNETVLRAETRASFPGVAGRAYRLLVVGSGGHRVAVRRLLSAVRRRAEAAPGALPND
jgi:hypothetical protein